MSKLMIFNKRLGFKLEIWRLLPVIICWSVFIYVILNISYPDSLTQASFFQLAIFFIPLFLALTFTINLFLRFILFSFSISLGIIILLVLKTLDSLNIASVILTIITISLLLSYFRQMKRKKYDIKSRFPKMLNLGRKRQWAFEFCLIWYRIRLTWSITSPPLCHMIMPTRI